ncbi:glycoside hydrolase family 2 TIM barrel-domain containing protein [Coralloluteibacterium stylophorae]|uniref:Glycoside hydrolase family 2 catalytic domain-containing protein n=1 Tax=Coralloluteibacterium stylophorae TaxID=1776034 RepID=A0A8J7VS20_9GAMM|nr:glycoside hydrolase family 2 TIM barrel-domain containing protein [Coralloluteibacterium stylophorae]MBS7457305.1 hypothetical protein [Coralloluteibacterium stylophorae]
MRKRAALLAAALLAASAAAQAADGAERQPSQVRIVEEDGRYRLLVDGEPFHIRGAGGSSRLQELAARGGNSFRTWRPEPTEAATFALLDEAQRLGLKVTMGLEVARERHGFDYDDPDAVAAQLARLREEVEAYRDHPALLMWAAGNELNLEATNPAVWDAVDDIAEMIHEVDPNHPVMTTLAGIGSDTIAEIKARADSLDLIGVQLYGNIDTLPTALEETRWTGPYVVTEWGPTGHWESPETSWGAPVEDTATRKAELLQERYRRDIDSDRTQGLGSYVFLWGNKQERTPTWYGLFLPSGEATPGVDAMQRLWTGSWPANRSPSITPPLLDGRGATDSVTLAPGATVEARVEAADPDGDALAFRWYVLEESTATSTGGDPEDVPPEVAVATTETAPGRIRLTAPAEAGNYRLFVEVRDGHDHAAYANLPFRVQAGAADD